MILRESVPVLESSNGGHRKEANATYDNLPFQENLKDRHTGENKLCYHHVTGACTDPKCKCKAAGGHVDGNPLCNQFAGHLCRVIQPGLATTIADAASNKRGGPPSGGGREGGKRARN